MKQFRRTLLLGPEMELEERPRRGTGSARSMFITMEEVERFR